jgi:predicted choloylglycine hydrolase
MGGSIPDQVSFTHVVLEGTPYAVGRLQGEMLKSDPTRAKYLTPPLPFLERYSRREAYRALDYLERYCPGVREEIQGAADAFGVPVEDMAFLGGKSKADGSSAIPVGEPRTPDRQPKGSSHCSHFVVLPPASEDGHLYAGQNEDCGPDDLDLRLCTTRVQGKAAHIGFSDMILGRVQGMNEHGFCVTTSWGAPGVWLKGEGLPYFAVVRALLDRCKTVDEALDVMADMPIAWCTNFIVADRDGEAALIEVAYAHRGIKRIRQGSKDRFLWATNHYVLPAMLPYDTGRMRQSMIRHRAIESRLGNAASHVGKDTMRSLLSEPMPEGVCVHHYSSGLGTLWSMILDATEATVDVCFGAPSSAENAWHTFGLQGTIGSTEYAAHLPDEPVAPGFWERLPPGAEIPQ